MKRIGRHFIRNMYRYGFIAGGLDMIVSLQSALTRNEPLFWQAQLGMGIIFCIGIYLICAAYPPTRK